MVPPNQIPGYAPG